MPEMADYSSKSPLDSEPSPMLRLAGGQPERRQTEAAQDRETRLPARPARSPPGAGTADSRALIRRLARAELDLATSRVQNQQLQLSVRRLIVALTDVSRRRSEAQHLAHHDRLTGLPNRRLLERHLRTGLDQARQQHRQLAMLFIDLDGFKSINDRHGHLLGDRLLVKVAQRISATLRSDDIACRYGGDEFVVLLLNVDQIDVANMIADKIRERIGRRCCIDGQVLRVTASIGVAIYPVHGDHYEALMGCADASMYRARSERRLATVGQG